MRLAPGSLITKSVRLERLLGSGGMGSIWIADHLTLNAKVAVKVVLDGLQQDEGARARFVLEAQAAAQIKSPHVAQVFDSGLTDDDLPFIIMELLEGEDLGQRIARAGRLELPEVAHVVSQTCKALSGAHTAGIVHRDIKPSNIFLAKHEDDLFVKVLDFGIAKHVNDVNFAVTTSGMMLGTPWYMSPEQIVSPKAVDFRSDLWSLAVAAYYALTGDVPFTGETLGAICVAISHGSYRAPSQLRAELPPAVDAWFARAFAVDPLQRFGSAREMANALSALAGLPANAFASSQSGDTEHVVRHAPLTPYDQVAATIASERRLPEAAPTPETLGGTSTPNPPQKSSVALYTGIGAALLLTMALLGAATIWIVHRRATPAVTDTASVPSVVPSVAMSASFIGEPLGSAAAIAIPTTSAAALDAGSTQAAPSARAGRGGRPGKPGTTATPAQVDRGF